MDLLSEILALPIAPVRAVLALGELIQRRAEEQLHDPATARRELEELERARAEGRISAEEQAAAERQIVERMMTPPGGAAAPADPTQRGGDQQWSSEGRASSTPTSTPTTDPTRTNSATTNSATTSGIRRSRRASRPRRPGGPRSATSPG